MFFYHKFIVCIFCMLGLCFSTIIVKAQELYVSAEPASTMPSRSIIFKQGYSYMKGENGSVENSVNNFNTQLEFSLNKKWMAHIGTNYTSWNFYTQYRFFSKDAIHEHLRMAMYFKSIQSSKNAIATNAILLEGEESVIQGGFIITQLKHKWASSLSVGPVLKRESLASNGAGGLQYSFSNGVLLYPKSYTSYGQTNVNLYLEFIGQSLFSGKAHYFDVAPAIQFIFNSQAKLNLSYRLPLVNQTNRATYNTASISWDYLFFNAIPKRKFINVSN